MTSHGSVDRWEMELHTHNNSTDTRFPQLARLCRDFGLAVIDTGPESPASGIRLAHEGDGKRALLTPAFPDAAQLEAYVADHMVDILHDYLFGEQA